MHPHDATSRPQPPGCSAGDPQAIAEELRDHLACTQEELEAAGLNPVAAEVRSRQRFGDVAAIAHELHRIHHRERIMSQRLLFSAFGLVFLSIGALTWMHQRSANEMAQAVKALTIQVAAAEGFKEVVTVRVVDETGATRAGVSLVVSADHTSGNVSNDFMPQTLTTNEDGIARSEPLRQGYYRLSKAEIGPAREMAGIDGPSFRVRNGESNPTLTFCMPIMRTISLALDAPAIKNWRPSQWVNLSLTRRYGETDFTWRAEAHPGETARILAPANGLIQASLQFDGVAAKDRQRGEFYARTHFSAESLTATEVNRVRLEQPASRTEALLDDGTIEKRPSPASTPSAASP